LAPLTVTIHDHCDSIATFNAISWSQYREDVLIIKLESIKNEKYQAKS